ncbi:hypothetical protein [Streptosporangium roseum]|uniref:hypothetical protein n=1 Tax=Streptosporangium roseum TaxID=2001 RepID=UPI0004CD01D0|nr:hypothetical protein [Streptosporangium roseum]
MIRLKCALAAGAVAASALVAPVAMSAQSAGTVPTLTSAKKPCSQYNTQQEREYCEQQLRNSGY